MFSFCPAANRFLAQVLTTITIGLWPGVFNAHGFHTPDHGVDFYTPRGLTAAVEVEDIRTIQSATLKGEGWTTRVYLASAPSKLPARLPVDMGFKPTSVTITYKLQKPLVAVAMASIVSEGNKVALPWAVLAGVYDLSRLKGDQKIAKTAGLVIKTSQAPINYAWGKGFIEFQPQDVKTAIAFDDPESLLKNHVDNYISGYLLLNFAKYSKEKEEQKLFRDLSERLLDKAVVVKWLESAARQ
jgi:hypothetical protein